MGEAVKRAALEKNRTRRTWKKHISFAHAYEIQTTGITACICDQQVNRFRKGQKMLGCGQPQCMSCHPGKVLGKPTIAELKARVVEKEGRSEL